MKGLAISDTHGFHNDIIIPEGTELIIHAGDGSNYRDHPTNSIELTNFFNWYKTVPVKHKIWVPGNHDTSYEAGYFKNFDFGDITILNHKSITIEGIEFFGSPYTPTFGFGWSYNKDRGKINRFWEQIPATTDILITHGPPKGILDLTTSRESKVEYCGDKCLLNHVKRVQPMYHIFGHIHDYLEHLNHGTRTTGDCITTFINATVVEDGAFEKGLIHQGITIEL